MRNEIIVQKMYRYAVKLMEYCEEYTYNAFIADMKTVEACVFNLSQLGSCAALWTFPLPSRNSVAGDVRTAKSHCPRL